MTTTTSKPVKIKKGRERYVHEEVSKAIQSRQVSDDGVSWRRESSSIFDLVNSLVWSFESDGSIGMMNKLSEGIFDYLNNKKLVTYKFGDLQAAVEKSISMKPEDRPNKSFDLVFSSGYKGLFPVKSLKIQSANFVFDLPSIEIYFASPSSKSRHWKEDWELEHCRKVKSQPKWSICRVDGNSAYEAWKTGQVCLTRLAFCVNSVLGTQQARTRFPRHGTRAKWRPHPFLTLHATAEPRSEPLYGVDYDYCEPAQLYDFDALFKRHTKTDFRNTLQSRLRLIEKASQNYPIDDVLDCYVKAIECFHHVDAIRNAWRGLELLFSERGVAKEPTKSDTILDRIEAIFVDKKSIRLCGRITVSCNLRIHMANLM
jgi:hypothetical protein